MINTFVRKYLKMGIYERVSLLLLIPANALYAIANVTHSWFELPGVAWYGLWWAKFCDNIGECHFVPAFFTNEPAFYHLLQLLCLLSWAGLALPIYLLLCDREFMVLKRNRLHSIAIICVVSAFILNGSLFLFYHMLNNFPREIDKLPKMNWAGGFAGISCGLQFIAGLLLLQT
ncbi:uncharacterized protein LOC128213964 [Mya arenaria]|uniref:uncharacterized protein LOC128213964 n=1 Tax=Mya arenaria TaxID=6604 RepID=UPI0022E03431|nr:uncharacterized protein LOC128213964 [Mya arenaria]